MDASSLSPSSRDELRGIVRRLLVDYTTFFSKDGIVNSEGRKLLESAIRLLVGGYPQYRRLVSRVRRDPTLENVLKLASIFMDEGELSELTGSYLGIRPSATTLRPGRGQDYWALTT